MQEQTLFTPKQNDHSEPDDTAGCRLQWGGGDNNNNKTNGNNTGKSRAPVLETLIILVGNYGDSQLSQHRRIETHARGKRKLISKYTLGLSQYNNLSKNAVTSRFTRVSHSTTSTHAFVHRQPQRSDTLPALQAGGEVCHVHSGYHWILL